MSGRRISPDAGSAGGPTSGRPVTGSRRRRGASRRRGRRRLLVLAAALVVLAVVIAVVLRAPGDDPFAGVYWDPRSGRRVEITLEDGRYQLLYGVAKHWYAAERHGDELQVRDPFSGYVLVRATDGDLFLVNGGAETKLEPLPADR